MNIFKFNRVHVFFISNSNGFIPKRSCFNKKVRRIYFVTDIANHDTGIKQRRKYRFTWKYIAHMQAYIILSDYTAQSNAYIMIIMW